MITTLFLILLAAFEIWYLTSKQGQLVIIPRSLSAIKMHPRTARIIASLLILSATVLFVVQLGIASGLIAAIIGLMAAGSLIVAVQPFQYIRIPAVVGIYVTLLLLEIFI